MRNIPYAETVTMRERALDSVKIGGDSNAGIIFAILHLADVIKDLSEYEPDK